MVMSTEISRIGRYRRIGDVARETGVATDTIRAWERRYQVVKPVRGPDAVRYYSPDDLRRLTMIKGLVDSGEAISRISVLEDDNLTSLFSELKPVPCFNRRWLVVSRGSPRWLSACVKELGISEIKWFNSFDTLKTGGEDFIVIDMPSLSEQREQEIIFATQEIAPQTLVLYQFASRIQLRRLMQLGYRLLKGPLEACAMLNHLS